MTKVLPLGKVGRVGPEFLLAFIGLQVSQRDARGA